MHGDHMIIKLASGKVNICDSVNTQFINHIYITYLLYIRGERRVYDSCDERRINLYTGAIKSSSCNDNDEDTQEAMFAHKLADPVHCAYNYTAQRPRVAIRQVHCSPLALCVCTVTRAECINLVTRRINTHDLITDKIWLCSHASYHVRRTTAKWQQRTDTRVSIYERPEVALVSKRVNDGRACDYLHCLRREIKTQMAHKRIVKSKPIVHIILVCVTRQAV